MCILDISKTCLYEFYHELPLYREKCKIMYTIPIQIVIYHIECDECMISRNSIKFDMSSDYPIDNAYGIPLVNKKVPG